MITKLKNMKTTISIFTSGLLLIFIPSMLMAQEERKVIREGNKAYNEGNYDDAELKYQKAMETNPQLFELYGNTANTQYRNAKFNDAALNYENIMKMSGNRNEKADAFYNMGNSYLQAAEYDKSIQAYKNALKLNPKHDMSRYNMAVATKIQEQQGGGGQNQQQQDKNQQDKNDHNKDKNQNDQKDKGDNGDDQNNDQNKDEQEKKQPQPKDNQMSREEMERFLESLQQQEKNVQEKVKNEKCKAQQRVVEKEW
jgi:Ca-activated chloride channel homolog